MKRTLCLLIMALCLIVSPLTVSARTYEISDTDMTVAFDDSVWYVFTRDNIAGNPELAELGFDYAEFLSGMLEDSCYVDAMLFFEDGDCIELIVTMEEEDFYVNLSNYDDSTVLDVGAATYEGIVEADDLVIFENDYKYLVADYFDVDVYVIGYLTVVNGKAYYFYFLSDTPFSEEQREIVAGTMEDVTFEVDTTMKEKNMFLYSIFSGLKEKLRVVAYGAGIAVLAAPVIIIITVVKNRKAKKNDFDQMQL